MKKLLFFFFLFPILLTAGSHDSISSGNMNMVVKMSGIAPLDIFIFPTVNIGVEHTLFRNFSLSGEFGYQFYGFYGSDSAFVKPSGYKAFVQARYYFPFSQHAEKLELSGKMTGLYAGVDFLYRHSRYNRVIEYTNEQNDTVYLSDRFWVEKKVTGINLLLGYQFKISNRFCFDFFGEVGGVNRKVMDHNLEFGSQGDFIAGTDMVPYFASQDLESSSGASFSFRFGFNIGYIIY